MKAFEVILLKKPARDRTDLAIELCEQMLTMISHDIRNPLGAIHLHAETISKKIHEAEDADDISALDSHAQAIMRSSLRMRHLISGFLERIRSECGAENAYQVEPTVLAFEEKRDCLRQIEGRPYSSGRIYLVEDDDDLREILTESIRRLGHEVIAFSCGQEVIQSLQRPESLQPDLIIADYRLPDMHGGEVIAGARMWTWAKSVPVILLSAEANLATLAKTHQASAFIEKPLQMQELSMLIQNLI